MRTMQDRRDGYIVLTFGRGYRKGHPRIVDVVQPYPNRLGADNNTRHPGPY